MALDRATILDASLELIDERGLDGFTLRALGEHLGVSQMAAYRHFKDKAAIIDALADQLLAEVRLDDPSEVPDPEERILSYTRRARTVLLAHPALVPVVAARPLMRAERVDDLLRLYETFRDAGFPDDFVVEAVLTMVSITLGLILYEQQRTSFDRSAGPSYQEDRLRLLADIEARGDAPPVSVDLARKVARGTWGEEVFETTVRECYQGLLRRATASR